ncbi:DUF4232 domain-containing protein [Spirilliplanes yamanashiensis]|uniref:DUF4232 domain-containing protein n=1 Tax=Spirilliplanes yamanashiensis TaxID=42233 RepID=A0A8J4DLS0_9ACTN|nr:DUF4232 domain-containing protein [Spirilliplanes yamanashiensis]MDP9816728.1 hypothetical protein [Spirilliplanes yamanashiensis]GIJ06251.1 hypothetical protein Sya03_56030 [Spirilliplanes yamanashiensis]
MERGRLAGLLPLLLAAGCAAPGTVPGSGTDTGSGTGIGRSAAPSGSAPECPADGLRVEAGETDAAMGLRVMTLRLVNCGTAPVAVDGRPHVRPLGADRRRLDVRVLAGTGGIAQVPALDRPPRAFTLRPGARAAAGIVWRSTYDDVREPPVAVVHLAVVAVPGHRARTVTPDGPLDLGSTGRFGVGPWEPVEPLDATPEPARPPVPSAEPVPDPAVV